MAAHYRVSLDRKIDGLARYLRVSPSGAKEWTTNIDEATTWPTASEAGEVARSMKPVPMKRIKFNTDKPSKVVAG